MLAIAALSARALVESAARDGIGCVALDVFGDADTRRAAARWLPIGQPAGLRIDGERLLAALQLLAHQGVTGWVAGSGFEGHPEWLEAGARILPLWGTAGADVRRVRDPLAFFDFLRNQAIAHPPVCFAPPRDEGPWLHKNSGGCGGWHVRRGAQGRPGCGSYWQRERAGSAWSATFVANGTDAVVLGFNRQLARAIGERPYLFAGVIGPVPPSEAMQQAIGSAVRTLAARFRVRGLASLDFVLHGERCEVIELNPRPPASLILYPRVGGHDALHAHLRACRLGLLPPGPAPADRVRGIEIVFARRALQLDAAGAAAIAAGPGVHDLPGAGAAFGPGDPLCSLSANGADADRVEAALAQRRDALLRSLENAVDA